MNILINKLASFIKWFLSTLFPRGGSEIKSVRLTYEDGMVYIGGNIGVKRLFPRDEGGVVVEGE